MKYVAIDELSHFQFHDAEINNIKFHNNQMIWEVSAVNAMTINTQNSFSEDMCIKKAIIIFENIYIESILFCAYEVYDSSNNLIESKESTPAVPSEYNDILMESLSSYCFIYSMEELPVADTGQYRACFNIDGGSGNYYLTVVFDKSIVKWDEFSGRAWYENEEWKNPRRSE